jgi:hypothetical protein
LLSRLPGPGGMGARPDDHRKVTLLGAKDAQPFRRR